MRVFACMASTLDGKIGPANTEQFVALGSKHDLEHLIALRDQADAVLFGAETFRAWPKVHRGTIKNRALHHFIMSRSLELDINSELFQDSSIPVTIFTNRGAENNKFPLHVELVRVPEDIPMPFIMNYVHSAGVESLLVEGGGQVIGQMVESKALQELYLTLVPKIMGQASAPGLLGGQDLTTQYRLEIIDSTQVGEETYLHVRFNYI